MTKEKIKSYMTRIKFCLTSRVFITAVILLSAFFIFNFVLAADNNVNDTLCSISEDDCDNYQANCQSHTFNWISGGYPSGAGNPQCCGDDSSEYYTTCAVYNPGPVCAGSGACCDSGNLSGGRFDCVYNGTCYNQEGRVDTSDTGAVLEVCLLTNSSAASWVDSDQGFEDQGSGFNSCTGYGYSWLTNYCENGNSCDDYDANLSN